MSDNKLHLSGDESRDMWEDINSIKPEKLQRIIYHIMCHTQNAEGDLSDSIQALTDKVQAIEDYLVGWKKPKMPPTGPVRFDPVLNDGKAKEKYEGEAEIIRHTQAWLDARKLPFDTGLSVLDSLKK